jgi:RNA polymerase sigma-70 factor, ECF subfamily
VEPKEGPGALREVHDPPGQIVAAPGYFRIPRRGGRVTGGARSSAAGYVTGVATAPLTDVPERDDQVWAWLEGRYREHGRQLQLFALGVLGNREDAEDATQIALLKAHRALVRGHRPSWPRAWLFAITHNVCRRVLSTRARGMPAPLDPELRAVGRDPDIPTGAEISRAVRSLPPGQREIFLLREMRGLSYDELSERLDLTPAAAGSLLARARKRLRDELAVPGERLGKRPLLGLPGAWTALRDAFQPTALKLATVVGAAAVAPGIAIGLHGAAPKPVSPAPVLGAPSAPDSRVATTPVVRARTGRGVRVVAVQRELRSADVTRRFTPAPPASAPAVAVPAPSHRAASAADPPKAVRAEDGAVEPTGTKVKHPRSVPSRSESNETEELTDEADEAVKGATDTAGDLVPTDQLPAVPGPPSVDQAVGNVGETVADLPGVSAPKVPKVPRLGG